MTDERKNLIGTEILMWMLNRDQLLAVRISKTAKQLATDCNCTEEEIREFLDPWVKYIKK